MLEFIVKYWVQFFLTVISSLLIVGFNYLKKHYKSENNIKAEKLGELESKLLEMQVKQNIVGNGVKALLKDRMIQSSNYHREKGFCSTHSLETVESLYKEYANLGGNGTATTLVEEMRKMPRAKIRKEG